MIEAVEQAPDAAAKAPLCRALGVSRATVYRRQSAPPTANRAPQDRSHRALSAEERQDVLDTLHSPRFVDQSPREVYAGLLDEGVYLCSIRTMYRVLEACGEVRERRDQLRHPTYAKPELMATKPNEVWSWDITKLPGPAKWSYFYLYVILDIYSRYPVGWMVATRESHALAKRLIDETVRKQDIDPGQLTLHADRGASMRSKSVALLLADLGVIRTHSRPHTGNDNPFSESQFKTLKYRPGFPPRFGSIQDARAFCEEFFPWYATRHHYTALGLLTPETVHYGQAERVVTMRNRVLEAAWRRNPERFTRGTPTAETPPEAVWINPPETWKSKEGMLTKCVGGLSHSG